MSGFDSLMPVLKLNDSVAKMDSLLSKKGCVPCSGGVPALKGEALVPLLGQLHSDWKVVDEHHPQAASRLERKFLFSGFQKGLDFTIAVGAIAEAQGHHPDIHLAWGSVVLTVWTHKINGLTESDFIFAAKVDQI